MNKAVKIEISARHIHVSKKNLESLFGIGYKLKKYKDLSQDGEFASQETVSLISDSGVIDNVRILGPIRENTQIEISLTDSKKLKISAPIRISGNVDSTPGIRLKGPLGEVYLEKGVIIAKRHFHCCVNTANELGLKNGDNVKVKISGIRGLIFDNVEVRVGENFNDAVHLDTDEGNACTDNGICLMGEVIVG